MEPGGSRKNTRTVCVGGMVGDDEETERSEVRRGGGECTPENTGVSICCTSLVNKSSGGEDS